jgi:hippurate hydrolase
MPLIESIARGAEDLTAWRREFHRHPELGFELPATIERVLGLLTSFGITDITTGVGRSGIVAVIDGQASGRSIGLRADMDALPIAEQTGLPYASTIAGRMHACGHDGHTTMLLGAARHLAATRNFPGRAVLIFQPAEEAGAGGQVMVKDGLIERFGIEEVYALHNYPGQATGTFAVRPGAIMAAADEFTITIEGAGGHAAWPHNTIDPVVVAGQLIGALQTLVSRNTDPLDASVVSVTQLHCGSAWNIIPSSAVLNGTVRTLNETLRDRLEARLSHLVEGIAASFGARAVVAYHRGYPATINTPEHARVSAATAAAVVGTENVDGDARPTMGGEDFSYMLQRCPGAYALIGNGPSAELHSATFDFNDEILPVGASYFASLVERRHLAS